MNGFQFTLRPTKNDERMARFRLIEQAWRAAYAHIYTPQEIDGVFDSTISSYGDWVDRRKGHVAHISADSAGEMIGFISLSLLKNDEGEVSALYILPAFQRHGVGQALWDTGCTRLQGLGCPAVWVWTLERVGAVHFYEKQGCLRADEGSYYVGEHHERAIGFRMELTPTSSEQVVS
jgi:ribosomal protein S18 acetylase RimI-like enzyme